MARTLLKACVMRRIACLLFVLCGGCGLYFGTGGGGGGAICNTPEPAPDIPVQTERDPYTGQCESVSNPQCGPCGVCNGTVEGGTPWASCASSCLGMNVATCEATAACQAEYLGDSYWGCFPVEPHTVTSPAPACSTLTADDCTGRDDCIAVYQSASSGGTSFSACLAEAPPPPPPAACSTLTTESDCLARSDCDAVYTGTDCTCDKSGCTCQTEVFSSCK